MHSKTRASRLWRHRIACHGRIARNLNEHGKKEKNCARRRRSARGNRSTWRVMGFILCYICTNAMLCCRRCCGLAAPLHTHIAVRGVLSLSRFMLARLPECGVVCCRVVAFCLVVRRSHPRGSMGDTDDTASPQLCAVKRISLR